MDRQETESALRQDLAVLEGHSDEAILVYNPFLPSVKILDGKATKTYSDGSMCLVGKIAHLATVSFAKETVRTALAQLAETSE